MEFRNVIGTFTRASLIPHNDIPRCGWVLSCGLGKVPVRIDVDVYDFLDVDNSTKPH